MRRAILCLCVLFIISACDSAERDRLRAENRASGVGVNGERFTIQVTGDVETEITPGFAQYFLAQDIGALQLLFYDGDSMYRVVLLLPIAIDVGTYDITPLIQQDRAITTPKAMIAGPRDRANFSMDADGQLTITEISERHIAGAVQFSVSNLDGQRVHAIGEFSAVPRTD